MDLPAGPPSVLGAGDNTRSHTSYIRYHKSNDVSDTGTCEYVLSAKCEHDDVTGVGGTTGQRVIVRRYMRVWKKYCSVVGGGSLWRS